MATALLSTRDNLEFSSYLLKSCSISKIAEIFPGSMIVDRIDDKEERDDDVKFLINCCCARAAGGKYNRATPSCTTQQRYTRARVLVILVQNAMDAQAQYNYRTVSTFMNTAALVRDRPRRHAHPIASIKEVPSQADQSVGSLHGP